MYRKNVQAAALACLIGFFAAYPALSSLAAPTQAQSGQTSSQGNIRVSSSQSAERGWKQDQSTSLWYYYQDDGTKAVGWLKISGYWYYFHSDGHMLTGWQQYAGSWYYLGSDGRMYTNWQSLDGAWYYLGSDGAMRTGWQLLDGIWYYLDSSGKMLTGWQKIDQEYYYLHEGKMLTGWLNDSTGQTYHMDRESGKMAQAWKEIDGVWYYFDTYGHMQKGWIQVSGKYYYLNPETGKMASNTTLTIDGISCSFGKDGAYSGDTSRLSGLADSYFDPSADTIGSSGTFAGTGTPSGNAPGSSGTSAGTGTTGSGQTTVPEPGSGQSVSRPGMLYSNGSSGNSFTGQESSGNRDLLAPGQTGGPGR